MSDLIERLRQGPPLQESRSRQRKAMKEAADEIERLTARVKTLEKQVSDAGWEAEARREQDEIARAKEWR